MELIREIHTMIVWSKASQVKPEIEAKIKAHFNLISQVEICWEKEMFLDNLKVFYSHSQKHRNEEAYNRILTNKIAHCGDDPFVLFVYEDESPIYDYRVTSSGNRKVNTNVFDFKKELRKNLGGGHKIHASDNTFEANKDLTLLFGLNSNDFINRQLESRQIETVQKKNCTGVGGYENIEQFFYVLNNSIRYCVIRNYECLPEEYTIEGHGDIDLLVEDLNYIKYLTLAKSYYPDLNYRVHYGIYIANELVPFDFRFVGDDYYDINWQNQILNNLVVFNSLVKVPDTINYFYSLLYHAYVQKRKVKADYFERLETMSKELNIVYHPSFSLEKIKDILDGYMIQNNFNYKTPKDRTVYFNQLFLNFDSSRADRFGQLISTQQARLDDEVLFTEVYDNGSEIIKFGSELIIKNEIKFLNILKDSKLVPEIRKTNLEPNNYFVVIEKLKGVQLNKALNNPLFWKKRNILSFISQCALFNEELINHNIMHRDIRPENILVHFNEHKDLVIKLIDFGWATCLTEVKKAPNPIGLGSRFKFAEGQYSDLYSTKKIIEYIFKQFHFKIIVMHFFDFKPDRYQNILLLKNALNKNKTDCLNMKSPFNFKDYLLLWGKRNKIAFNILLKIKRFFKIKLSNYV